VVQSYSFPSNAPSGSGMLQSSSKLPKISEADTSDRDLPDNTNAVLVMSVTAHCRLPTMQDVPALPHQNKFTSEFPNELSLIDPEVEVSHDAKTGPFTVEAKKACPFMLG
jgi:beta-mannosidase